MSADRALNHPAIDGKRVLITGASGFVGGRLAERLIAEHGCTVVALIRNWTKAVWISRYPAILIQGDVRDRGAVLDAASSCDVVFHCASGGGSDEEYLDINISGTQNILDACVAANVKRLIFVSTIAVHGPSPSDGANEDEPFRSFGRGYSDSKIAAEKLVMQAGRDRGLDVCILRPTFVWGPRSALFTVRPLRQIQDGTFRLVDEGRGTCHAVFIEHLIDALIAASTANDIAGKALLVTDGYELTWREFFQPYLEWLGRRDAMSISSRSGLVKLRCRTYQALQKNLEKWKSNPAPLWRKILRRTGKYVCDHLSRSGVMNEWDLAKFARLGNFDTSSTQRMMGGPSRYTFHDAMRMTEAWVRDQMGYELNLSDEEDQQ